MTPPEIPGALEEDLGRLIPLLGPGVEFPPPCFTAMKARFTAYEPRTAITITLPVFTQARHLVAVVPGPRKARAVRGALLDPVGPACPATIIRTHPQATLFLDRDSAALLPARRDA